MLAGKGFTRVYNLSGGIRAWEKPTAVGGEDQGLELFIGNETAEESIVAAFGLEEGLREFYLAMQQRSTDEGARNLFIKLADIEILHQEQLLELYNELTGKTVQREEFTQNMVIPALEGGMTTEEYLAMHQPDFGSVTDILSMAMAIEAQALDLYQRAADRIADIKAASVLQKIANEERAHLQSLADYMERV
jgi:rubrerythrin